MQSYPPSPPMQPAPPPKRPWFRTPLGIGCLVVLGAFLLCGVIGAIGNAARGSSPSSSPTTTPSRVGLLTQEMSTPTDTPTASSFDVLPTDTPTPLTQPTPTDAPTATPTLQPTVIPTQAAQPTPHPTRPPVPTPTRPPAPTPTHCVGVNNNPWCYDFRPGNLIYNPPSAFCNYFICVSTFWTANHGYVAECADTHFTHSGGVGGACSHNGGVLRPLYSH